MAPSKGITVLGCFLLTSPVLPPAPHRAVPALLSLSHPPCAPSPLLTGAVLPVQEASQDLLSPWSQERTASLSLPVSGLPAHRASLSTILELQAGSLPSLRGSLPGWECCRDPREGTGPMFTLSASSRALCTHPGPALPLLTPQQSTGSREWHCWLGMEQGKGFVWIPLSSLWLL